MSFPLAYFYIAPFDLEAAASMVVTFPLFAVPDANPADQSNLVFGNAILADIAI